MNGDNTRNTSIGTGIALAVILIMLAASAQPVSAASTTMQNGTLVVGSQHDTQSDFQNATSLQSMTVDGDSVVLDDVKNYSYNPMVDSATNTSDHSESFVGDDSNDHAQNIEVRMDPTVSGNITQLKPYIESVSGSDYGFTVDVYIVDEAPDDSAGEGTLVKSNWDPDFQTGVQSINISKYEVSSGSTYTVEFVVSGSDNDGTTDSLTIDGDLDAGDTWYTVIHGSNVHSASMKANMTATIRAPPQTATYVSDNHSVGHVSEARINISEMQDADANLSVEYYDNGWKVANSTTVSSTGNHSVQIPSTNSEIWRTNVTVTSTGGNSSFRLADESILFNNHQPQADNLSPPDGTELSQKNVDFSVDVSDTEFGSAQGDSVKAALYIDNQQVGSKTVTSNQTVTISESLTSGGEHTYHWELTDEYGSSTTSNKYNVSVPDKISIYNESDPDQLVDNASATITFYFDREDRDDLVVTRNASDGTVNMTDLPADKPFIAVVSADGYFNRRIFVRSLYRTQSIYMLNESVDAVQPTFTLTDFTGNYPLENTVLEVQKQINGTWQTVEGDYFGATNKFSTVLMFNERHRLIVRNVATGKSRDLGVFTPVETTEVIVNVYQDTDTVSQGLSTTVHFKPTVGTLPALDNTEVSVDVNANNDTLSEFTYVVSVNGTELVNKTYTDPDGKVATERVDLSSYGSQTLNVSVTWTTDAGQTGSVERTYQITRSYDNDQSLVDSILGIGSGQTSGIASLMALFVTAMAVGVSASRMGSEGASGVGVLVFGGFALVDWVAVPWFFAMAIAWLVFTGIRRPV